MTTFDFTPRLATFVKRSIQAYTEDFKKDFEEKSKMTMQQFKKILEDDNTEDEYTFKIKSIIKDGVGIKVFFQIEFESDDDEDTFTPIMDSFKPMIAVCYTDLTQGNNIVLAKYYGFTECDWVDSLIKPYIICLCNTSLAEINEYCKDCYTWAMKQDDVCCCCGENEGVWVQLKCKHLIHRHCWEKIEVVKSKRQDVPKCRKCPLCRGETAIYDYDRV